MKNGWLILWSATAICEKFKSSWHTGKHLMNGDSENHSKARWFHLVEWLMIFWFLHETRQGSTYLARKCYKNIPRKCINRGRIWKDILVADMEELENLDASEINAKEVLTPMKGDSFFNLSRRWSSQKPLEEIDV